MSKAQDQITQMSTYFISKLQEAIDNYVNDPNPEHHKYHTDNGFKILIGILQVLEHVAKHFDAQGYQTIRERYFDKENVHCGYMLYVRFPSK